MKKTISIFLLLGLCWVQASQDSLGPVRLQLQTQVHSSWELASWFEQQLKAQLQFHEKIQVLEPADSLIKPSALLSIQLAPESIRESRVPVFFWQGRRTYELSAQVNLQFLADSADSGRVQKVAPDLQANLMVDTAVSMGYCGILDCHVRPLDSKLRMDLQKQLMNQWVALLLERLDQLLVLKGTSKN